MNEMNWREGRRRKRSIFEFHKIINLLKIPAWIFTEINERVID